MANRDWLPACLRDLIEVKHGFAFSGEFFSDEPTTNILLTPGNFAIGGGFKTDKLKYYTGSVPHEYVLEPEDLMVTMTDLSKESDTLGYPALVPASPGKRYLHNQRLGRVVILDESELDKHFLYFLLRTQDYRNEVLASASGSVIKHTSPDRIRAFEFSLPPLTEQRAIAHVLGTLDDKIELNRRMNETLEAMARALFKSWFVDFDPVRAKVVGRQPFEMDAETAALFPASFEDSPLGEVPKGWEVVPLPEVVEVNPVRSLKKDTVAPYLDMANMPTQGHRALEWIERPFGSGTRFIDGDTLLARITPCLENGKTAFVDFLQDGQVGWGSTEYIVLRPRLPLPVEYGYYLARSDALREHTIMNMTGTSGRQRAPASCFDKYLLAVPPDTVAQQFGEFAKASIAVIRANDEQSRTLATLRDALLPKLLSGGVRIVMP